MFVIYWNPAAKNAPIAIVDTNTSVWDFCSLFVIQHWGASNQDTYFFNARQQIWVTLMTSSAETLPDSPQCLSKVYPYKTVCLCRICEVKLSTPYTAEMTGHKNISYYQDHIPTLWVIKNGLPLFVKPSFT